MEKPNFYAIIPAYVRYDNELNPSAKLLFGELSALANDRGYCYATNNYFAKLYGVAKETISRWISLLEKKKYIKTELVRDDRQIIMRKIYIVVSSPIDEIINRGCENPQGGIDKSIKTPIEKKRKKNTIDKNTTRNIKENIVKEKYFENESLNEVLNEYLELRIEMKLKNTSRAVKALLEKLKQYGKNDQERIEVLENSIVNNWKTLYPLKGIQFGKQSAAYINPVREAYSSEDTGITFV